MTPYKYSQFPKYILKRPWFLKPNSLRLYIYLLLEANYQDNYKSNNIPLLKNQLLTSSNSLEKALELTRQKVETALETLKKTGDIEIKTTPKYSIITLLFDNKQKTGEEASKEVLFIFSQLPKYIKTKNWFLKPKTLRLYIYLLSNKSYKKTLINNIPLLKDQLLTSINSLEKALKLTTKEIRTALKHLQETNDIAIKPTTKYSIITLLFEESFDEKSQYKEKENLPLADIINKIAKLLDNDEIEIEIVGSWLWISGDSKQYKNEIKEAGFRFSGAKKMWFYSCKTEYKSIKSNIDIDKIRSKYGSEILKNKSQLKKWFLNASKEKR